MEAKWNLELQAYIEAMRQGVQMTPLLEAGTFERDGRRYVECVVKYQGDLEMILQQNWNGQIAFEELIAGYAILICPTDLLEEVSELWEISYLEKARGMRYNQLNQSAEIQLDTTCVSAVTGMENGLSGKGVLIAILDSGIQGGLREFENSLGESRILYQNRQGDVSGHGTAVASIAAGSTIGVARESDIFVYRLEGDEFFIRSTDVMRGVTRALKEAERRQMPLVINLSLGFPYGSHRGDSLLERFLDNACEIGRTSIVVGSGNEAESNGHVETVLQENRMAQIEFMIGEYEYDLVMELYFGCMNIEELRIVAPDQSEVIFAVGQGQREIITTIQGAVLYGYFGEVTPYSGQRQIYLQWIAIDDFLIKGVWNLRILADNIKDGTLQIYMPTDGVKNLDTGFYRSTPEGTITIPATAHRVISVGASDLYGTRYASFSGRGFARRQEMEWQNKPDLVAPGENVVAINREGEQILVSGTSFAAPIVTGAVALMMEWGIVRGNDPYCYGQKCKSRLIEGCERLRGEPGVPNERTGWGLMCLKNSIRQLGLS